MGRVPPPGQPAGLTSWPKSGARKRASNPAIVFPTRFCRKGNAGGDEDLQNFIGCDAAQAELARVAGMTQVHLFR
jgi:hypothetical protein